MSCLNPKCPVFAGDDGPESWKERLYGLTEMIPVWMRNLVNEVVIYSRSGIVHAYKVACFLTWVTFSTSMLLAAPVVFETKREQYDRGDGGRVKLRDRILTK